MLFVKELGFFVIALNYLVSCQAMVLLQCLPTVHAGAVTFAVTFAGPFGKGGWDAVLVLLIYPYDSMWM